jgi:hypothetical protein
MSQEKNPPAANAAPESNIDRLERVVEKLVGAVVAMLEKETKLPSPMEVIENNLQVTRLMQESVQRKLAESEAEHHRLNAELEQGPKKFDIVINGVGFDGQPKIVNRLRRVGARDRHEAQSKYCEFYGITGIGEPSKIEVTEVTAA